MTMPSRQREISRTDTCGVCKELLRNEVGDLEKQVMEENELGLVHADCYFPFHPEEQVKIILYVSCYSMGDTITCTPIIREIRRLYPRAHIDVATWYPDIFKYNPHINQIYDFNQKLPSLEGIYTFEIKTFKMEAAIHFATHSMDFASLSAFSRQLNQEDWEYEVLVSPIETNSMLEVCKREGLNLDSDKLILVNPHKTEWPTRDWGKVHFAETYEWLKNEYPDYKIVSLGGKRTEVPSQQRDNYIELPGVTDLFGKLTILESIALCRHPASKLMITPDTGALHLAACAPELPIVGIFTVVRARFRTPVRNKILSYKFYGIDADTGCDCTYSARLLTNNVYAGTCPKKTFLEQIMRSNIPRTFKFDGLRNSFPEVNWNPDEGIQKQVLPHLNKFSQPSIPCFPTVDKVKRVIQKAMNEHNARVSPEI
jgi:ADP-heptose:LPS heptosyltransferase